jgi:hypothetical protein
MLLPQIRQNPGYSLRQVTLGHCQRHPDARSAILMQLTTQSINHTEYIAEQSEAVSFIRPMQSRPLCAGWASG